MKFSQKIKLRVSEWSELVEKYNVSRYLWD